MAHNIYIYKADLAEDFHYHLIINSMGPNILEGASFLDYNYCSKHTYVGLSQTCRNLVQHVKEHQPEIDMQGLVHNSDL